MLQKKNHSILVAISDISVSSVQVLKDKIPGVNYAAEQPAVPKNKQQNNHIFFFLNKSL